MYNKRKKFRTCFGIRAQSIILELQQTNIMVTQYNELTDLQ